MAVGVTVPSTGMIGASFSLFVTKEVLLWIMMWHLNSLGVLLLSKKACLFLSSVCACLLSQPCFMFGLEYHIVCLLRYCYNLVYNPANHTSVVEKK